ncbi:MAG: hypothetical protein FJ104_03840 [Deltaproteobacteria bacterium]|nr:hypothetical protein [Deltaproteobacteria bacterium]
MATRPRTEAGRAGGDLEGLEALFALHYHGAWQRLGLTPPESLPLPVALPSLEEGAARLVERAKDDVESGLALALGFAELHRPRAGAPVGALDEAHRRALGHLRRGLDLRSGRDAAKVLDDPALGLDALLGLPSDQAFLRAFSSAAAVAGLPHRVSLFQSSFSYRHRVTDYTLRIDVDRPLVDFQKQVDPREWHTKVPLVWKKSFPTKLPRPADRDDDGAVDPSQLDPPAAVVPAAVLFEEAVWPGPLLQLTNYRNLLDVTIDVSLPLTGARRGIGFTYQQASCLTSTIAGIGKEYGGIDVDSGYGRAIQVAPRRTRLEARKRARFSKPGGALNRAYNELGAVYLPVLINWLVLAGTQL